jgi:hypothetical protein
MENHILLDNWFKHPMMIIHLTFHYWLLLSPLDIYYLLETAEVFPPVVGGSSFDFIITSGFQVFQSFAKNWWGLWQNCQRTGGSG